MTLELEEGVYDVRISKDAYETATETAVSLSRGETTVVSITLREELPEPAELTVRVTDGGGGDIRDAVVDIEDEDGQSIETGRTAGNGCVMFELDPATYTVVARHTEYDTATDIVELEGDGELTLSLTLESAETTLAV